MKTQEMLLKMLDDPNSELNKQINELDAEVTCENLEEMTKELTMIVGRVVLQNAIQIRADEERETRSACPHCADQQTLARASFSPSGKEKKSGRRRPR